MLCSLDKMKQKSIKKWDREHDMYIQEFKHKLNKTELSLRQPTSKPPHGLLIRKHSTIILCGFVPLHVLNLTHSHFARGHIT